MSAFRAAAEIEKAKSKMNVATRENNRVIYLSKWSTLDKSQCNMLHCDHFYQTCVLDLWFNTSDYWFVISKPSKFHDKIEMLATD